ncbi:MAG: hypothetical protein E5X86_11255 [Mesorhizobium sp.]|uniref:hypothetical protein n=1 Tax=Mesorhizobium sp. TaxID=1871066 RepID=UPI000FE96F27|nr:hypothetical protein [Mesorhizobium sp.]RWI08745.1 MAG: hypothetical protein EOQ90_16850 [Mesorhizobium sp.]RWM85625.1 MAG: hypothetical protein EOR83_10115 [Mesorhizobium sp.]TIO17475.1 MAG: hypothetical protein E5X86_11255 [Mesorhizobium sp.]TIP92509.1 MAG: hypothetical protein E5X58_15260 [Mesorhizobium sp.]
MSRINRRALLLSSGSAVIASMGAATAYATEPRRRDREPSPDLRALIKVHKATYAAFGKAIQERDGSNREHDRASRAEERALLAVCAYPAVREGDRRAKARYLLKIEARGELDLAEHMQALLRSTMGKGKGRGPS